MNFVLIGTLLGSAITLMTYPVNRQPHPVTVCRKDVDRNPFETFLGVSSKNISTTVTALSSDQPCTPFAIIFNTVPITCLNETNGMILVDIIIGDTGPYTISIDNAPPQKFTGTTLSFSGLAAGAHILTVTDSALCSKTIQTFIEIPNPLGVVFTTEPTSCSNKEDGVILIRAVTGGTPPYLLQIDDGADQQFTGEPLTFSGLTMDGHTITVTDSALCSKTIQTFTELPNPLEVAFTTEPTSSLDKTEGTLLVTAVTGGTPPYLLQVDNGVDHPFTGEPLAFSDLTMDPHALTVTDSALCTTTIQTFIGISNPLEVAFTTAKTSCPGNTDGTIVITAIRGGTAPYHISLDGETYQEFTGTPLTFSGLSAGDHTIIVTDSVLCSIMPQVTIDIPTAIEAIFTSQPLSCHDLSDGTIVVTAISGGTAPYHVSVDGGTSQEFTGTPLSFSDLTAGDHTITITDNVLCSITPHITIETPTAMPATITTQPLSCPDVSDGTLVITAISGGTAPYHVSVDGETSQVFTGTPLTFSGLSAGDHTITITDSVLGSITPQASIETPTALPGTITTQPVSSPDLSDGPLVVTAISEETAPSQVQVDEGTPKDFTGEPLILTSLKPGVYSLKVSDANDCEQSIRAVASTSKVDSGILEYFKNLLKGLFSGYSSSQ
ncbi:SprB repeat-containing protein [Candidatus Dependentiae bacterium]|nr:SprB repeat-containing protein [Candidatus Dependentiae bacterium]